MSICLGCCDVVATEEPSGLPELLHGQFCARCAARLGFTPPLDEEDDADEEQDDSDE